MIVTIVGMGGVAAVAAHNLAKDTFIEEIRIISNNLGYDRQFITPKDKIHLLQGDAKDVDCIAYLAGGSDLIVNACSNFLNIPLMHASLKANSNYQDLALTNNPPEQLTLHDEFRNKGLVGLICTGMAPGVSNLLVKESSDKMDSLDKVKLYSFEEQRGEVQVTSWSKACAIDTLLDSPSIYVDGKYISVEPFSGFEEYDFPSGKRATFTIYGDEVATLPRYIPMKDCVLKASGSDIEIANALYHLGLFSKNPVQVEGKSIIPFKLMEKLLPEPPTPVEMQELLRAGKVVNGVYICVVESYGVLNGEKACHKQTARFLDLEAISKEFPGATYISYPTGLAAAAFSKVIPKIDEKGVFPPEALPYDLRKEVLVQLQGKCFVLEEEFGKA